MAGFGKTRLINNKSVKQDSQLRFMAETFHPFTIF